MLLRCGVLQLVSLRSLTGGKRQSGCYEPLPVREEACLIPEEHLYQPLVVSICGPVSGEQHLTSCSNVPLASWRARTPSSLVWWLSVLVKLWATSGASCPYSRKATRELPSPSVSISSSGCSREARNWGNPGTCEACITVKVEVYKINLRRSKIRI